MVAEVQLSELIEDLAIEDGVCFDPDSVSLIGVYSDQLSAYRARKIWHRTLLDSFLLDDECDLSSSITHIEHRGCFVLSCKFLSATARYAFWKITQAQAPEEQYVIETAHIASVWNRAAAPDLKRSPELALDGLDFETSQETVSLIDRIVGQAKRLFDK